MSRETKIEWTETTWNPTRGCSRVSEGCRHCYAEQQAARIVRMAKGKPSPYDGLVSVRSMVSGLRYTCVTAAGSYDEPRWTGKVVLDPNKLAEPLRWRHPREIFVNSMSDLFHESLSNEQIAAVFGVMAACPQHTFQVLTKRAKRMRKWFEWAEEHGDGHDMMRFGPSALLTCAWEASAGDVWGDDDDGRPNHKLLDLPNAATYGTSWPLPNVWIGVSVENQEAADERIPHLLATPAAVRFLSCEPLLGLVDLRRVRPNPIPIDALTGRWSVPQRDGSTQDPRVHWVIAGCESGPGARPCATAWLRDLRDQCADADVPYFLKQANPWAWVEGDRSPGHRDDDRSGAISAGVGSKRKPGGVIGAPYLDGRQHLAKPVRRGKGDR